MGKGNPAKLTKLALRLPFGLGEAEWKENAAQREAAWKLYVELVTRVTVQPLGEDEGIMRETLDSLYAMFEVTREVLKAAGPDVGAKQGSVGGLAIGVLNKGLRPFLGKWHSALRDHEDVRREGVSARNHEIAWSRIAECRSDLERLREHLRQYAKVLGVIAEVI